MGPSSLGKKLQKARDSLKDGDFAEALSIYATLARDFPLVLGEYGAAAAESGDFELADRLWDKARSLNAKDVRVLFWLANQYGSLGMHAKSRALFAEAAALEPRNLEAQGNLAAFLARTKSVAEARPAVNKCLELDARNESARFLAAHLDRRENKLAEAQKQFDDLIASGLKQPQIRYSCYSESAQILEKTGRFDEAMTRLQEAKSPGPYPQSLGRDWRSAFKQPRDEVDRVKSFPKNILATWGHAYPPKARNAVAPVAFLSGSSRSGTTLLERILDAHPSVAACDESMVFKKMQRRVDVAAPSVPAQRLNALRELYERSMAAILGAPSTGKTILDKNPARTVWLPAFLRALPELRVLIALRDPRDVLISLYFQDHNSTNMLTLEQLAYYYSLVMDGWLAVREWEGLAWMETRYEDIVTDLEKEGRRVTEFLGLQWHENQARYYEHNLEKPVLSNNTDGIMKPVYKSAMGRWRAYEKHLAPILPALEPYCRKFGYE